MHIFLYIGDHLVMDHQCILNKIQKIVIGMYEKKLIFKYSDPYSPIYKPFEDVVLEVLNNSNILSLKKYQDHFIGLNKYLKYKAKYMALKNLLSF